MSLPDETRTEWRAKAEKTLADVETWRANGFPPDPAVINRAQTILALLDEIDQLRAEVETARTAYRLTIRAMEGEIAENDGIIRTLRHQRDDAEAAVDRVRALHDQYLPAAVDYDCCGHCNIGGNYVPWPCPTIRALEGAEQ